MKYIYKVKRLKNVKFIKDCCDGYKINPKIKDFDITSITIYDKNIISYYIEKNFLFKFKKLLELMQSEDDDTGDYVLTQIDSLENIILNEYKNFLSIEQLKTMLKDLYFLKHKVVDKNMLIGKSR